MSDAPKSAYEIAMEKLRARDAASGEKAAPPLTDAQRREIAEIRSLYAAKIAEREILYNADLRRAGQEPEKIKAVEDSYVDDRRRLEAERESKIEKVRAGRKDARKRPKS